MMIHKITPSLDYNWWLKRLDTQLYKPNNQMHKMSPKLLNQQIRKLVINIALSPSFRPLLTPIICCRHRTQEDWRYWVFTSIMGHFVHSFAQEVSNISPREMERTSLEWLQVNNYCLKS